MTDMEIKEVKTDYRELAQKCRKLGAGIAETQVRPGPVRVHLPHGVRKSGAGHYSYKSLKAVYRALLIWDICRPQ